MLSKREKIYAPMRSTGIKVWPEPSGPPDFVGVGAQRCGTTRWFGLMAQHPDIYIPYEFHKELQREQSMGIKERHFFERFVLDKFGERDIKEYHSDFPRPKGHLTGEWTTCYMYNWWTPSLLKRAAPDTKLLVILRDPVERYISGVSYVGINSHWNPMMLSSDAVSRGYYYVQLLRLLEYFDRDQILILQYERCCLNPKSELTRTYRFLGLEPFMPDNHSLKNRVNSSRQRTHILENSQRAQLVDTYALDVRKLCTEFDIDLDMWKNFR